MQHISCQGGVYVKEALNKSFDKPHHKGGHRQTNAKLLIPFIVYSALVVELVEP
jgi:hypothetical protein